MKTDESNVLWQRRQLMNQERNPPGKSQLSWLIGKFPSRVKFKVEMPSDKAHGHVNENMIFRYRFLDLFPCTKDELRAMGYKDSSLQNTELVVSWLSKMIIEDQKANDSKYNYQCHFENIFVHSWRWDSEILIGN